MCCICSVPAVRAYHADVERATAHCEPSFCGTSYCIIAPLSLHHTFLATRLKPNKSDSLDSQASDQHFRACSFTRKQMINTDVREVLNYLINKLENMTGNIFVVMLRSK